MGKLHYVFCILTLYYLNMYNTEITNRCARWFDPALNNTESDDEKCEFVVENDLRIRNHKVATQMTNKQYYYTKYEQLDNGNRDFALMNKKGNYHWVAWDQYLWPHTQKVFNITNGDELWPQFKSEPVGNVTYDKFEAPEKGDLQHVAMTYCGDWNSFLGQCVLDTNKNNTKIWEMNSASLCFDIDRDELGKNETHEEYRNYKEVSLQTKSNRTEDPFAELDLNFKDIYGSEQPQIDKDASDTFDDVQDEGLIEPEDQ